MRVIVALAPVVVVLSIAVPLASCGGGQEAAPAGPAAPARAHQGEAPSAGDAPADGDPSVAGDASADGPGKLPMAEVSARMDGVREKVKECAARTSYEGKVSVRVVIAPAGAATVAIVQGSGEPEVDTCVTGAFRGVSFPASRRGQHFVYSFTF